MSWAPSGPGSSSGGRFDGRGGRGFRGGGFRGGGGRAPGRGRNFNGPGGADSAVQPIFTVCAFYARGGQCNRGDSCKFSHTAVSMFAHQAHKDPIKSVEVMHVGEIPKILTGSTDGTVSVWNLGAQVPTAEGTVKTSGKVTHLEVKDSTILWAVDEPISPEMSPELTVGTVYLLNSADMSTIPVKRSDDMPYTHPLGDIRSFLITAVEGVTYLITAGGEGVIRTWKFDTAAGKFEPLTVLEGHFRAVTCLLLNDNFLWSGSVDTTLRVWDLGGRCVGMLNQHADAITALCFLPPSPSHAEAFICSGSADTEVKMWKANGEFVGGIGHRAPVTCLSAFQDAYGGVQSVIVGLMDGGVQVRATTNLALIFSLDSSLYNTGIVWGIKFLGKSCFAVGGEDGQLIVWKVDVALVDKK